MAAWKLGPALATGCTVVLKPAEQTPLSALAAGRAVSGGRPARTGVVNVVTGFGETAGAALAAHPRRGQGRVHRLDRGRQADRARPRRSDLKKVTLELGGKSPNIIFEDADLETAIPGAANAIFFNQGQCCCAGSRLYVEQKDYDEVVEGVAEFAKRIKVGRGSIRARRWGRSSRQSSSSASTGYLRLRRARGRQGGGRWQAGRRPGLFRRTHRARRYTPMT